MFSLSLNQQQPEHGRSPRVRKEEQTQIIPMEQNISRPLITPNANQKRPYDALGRPAADPIQPRPIQVRRGRRDQAILYNADDGSQTILDNVLFRDYSKDDVVPWMRHAYYPSPSKQPIQTIMGHVEICTVLVRCRRRDDRDNVGDVLSDGSSRGMSDGSSRGSNAEDEILYRFTKRRVAVKVNSCSKIQSLAQRRHAEDPFKEISAMQMIGNSNDHVMGCIEVLHDGQNLNVIMQYCDSGDLYEHLIDQQMRNSERPEAPGGLPEDQARFLFRQLIKGLECLHEEYGICHKDLSPENVMIDKGRAVIIDLGMCLRMPYQVLKIEDDDVPRSFIIKVTDLRSARKLGASPVEAITNSNGEIKTSSKLFRRRCLMKCQGPCGKLPYMAPEIFRNRDPYDGEAVDIWSAGIILFCMVTGNRSYERPHISDLQFCKMTTDLEQLLTEWNVTLSMECVHLIQNIIQVDPRVRLTLKEIINHPWLEYPDENPTPPVTNNSSSARVGRY